MSNIIFLHYNILYLIILFAPWLVRVGAFLFEKCTYTDEIQSLLWGLRFVLLWWKK